MALKLRSCRGNYVSLKILVAGAVTGTEINTEEVKEANEGLPVLIVNEETKLTSSNDAVRHLFRESGSDVPCAEVENLLEWETTQLQPCVLSYLTSKLVHNKSDSELSTHLSQLLQYLNSLLGDKQYLVSESLSAADVSVWCTLYALLADVSLLPPSDVIGDVTNVTRWFQTLLRRADFAKGVEEVTGGEGAGVFKESLSKMSTCAANSAQPSSKSTSQTESKGSQETGEASEEPWVSGAEVSAAKQSWLAGDETLPQPREQKHPKQPIEGERNILITAALPYVNNVPHLGNIIGCVLSADVYSRFCRLRNYNSLYLCGTDEYGTATETKALAEGLTPAEICTKYNKIHSDVYKWFNIDFDYFGRTTTEWQTKISQDIFWQLYNNGYILKDSVEQLKCENCERFLADRFVEGTCPLCRFEDARGDQCDGCGKLLNATELIRPRCKLCAQTPAVKSSSHLFLDLPALTDQLSSFLDTRFTDSSLWSANAKLITKSWLRDGLKPRCITRDLKWGTPVPLEGYTDKVFYVWFDAPIGYLSIGANYDPEWEKWWKNPEQVELYQFLGKDNVPFHSVIFPSSLLGTGKQYTLVSQLSATEYLNYEDTKFSKSRGTGVFGNDASDTQIPADIWRFYLLFVRPESQDSSFSWDDFMLKNNSELLNNLGNFINRALVFVTNYFSATIPEMTPTEEDFSVLAQITREIHNYIDDLEHLRLRDALRRILSISRLGNQFMQANKPWVAVKGSAEDKSRAGTVVGLAANISCLISVLLQPYMPQVSATIQDQLQAHHSCNYIADKFVCRLKPGHKIGKPSPLFAKLDAKLIEELKKKYAGVQQPAKPAKSAAKPGQAVGQNGEAVAQPIDAEAIEALNLQITEQGNVVRELKTAKADKDKITVEVEKLLDLKKRLTLASGEPEPASGGKKKKNKKK